jgi:putative oxidoreductase
MNQLFKWLEKNKDIGLLLLRLFIGLRLLYAVKDPMLSWENMKGVGVFFAKYQFPYPLISAVIAVCVEFFCALLLIIGWKVRYAAILLTFTFAIAWIMVDRHHTVERMTPALSILFCSVLFVFQGGGNIGLEKNK